MMKQNRNRLTAWLSAVILTAALLALPVYVPAAAEDVVFTQQPQSGVVNIGQPYTFTFETNRPCECMLQMREGSTYDWGNMEIVTSPYTIPDHPFEATFEYRLIVDEEEKTYYSDVFTVQWKRAENETTLYIEDGTFSDLPLGYGAVEAVPLAVTNTGAYATENLRAYLAEDSSLELIENRTPQAIPAGQTDHETWSVRPRQGLGVGYYQDSVFFAADNVEITTVFYPFTVVESDAEIVYEAQADPIDFGTLPVGYGEQEMIDLTVRATGTGNLSHVHLQLGEGADRFFSLQAQNASLDTLHAGQSTGSNWSLRLNSGLTAGTYEWIILIHADELEKPLEVPVRVTITGGGQGDDPADDPGEGQQGDGQPDGASSGVPLWAFLIAAAVAAGAVAAAVVLLLRKKKN